ncbi:MAG: preprotein translocase subunit YajC [Geminicoccaceae bacterium]
MLISPAYAQAAGAGSPDFFVSMLPLVLIFVVFWFLLIRPQQKKMREHREMIAAIKKGDKIVTGGGLIGTVAKVEEQQNVLVVELAENVKVRVAQGTVSGLYEPPKPAAPKPAGKPANDDSAEKGGFLQKLLGGKKS